jgi:hypothetical protein
MTDRLQSLLSDSALHSQMALRARELAVERYDWDATARDFLVDFGAVGVSRPVGAPTVGAPAAIRSGR